MKFKIGIFLIILSFVLYLLIVPVPFLELSAMHKTLVISTLVVVGEVTFYVGLLLVGNVFWQKSKQKIIDYLCFFCKKKNQANENEEISE